jgi:hypothetical protein
MECSSRNQSMRDGPKLDRKINHSMFQILTEVLELVQKHAVGKCEIQRQF